MSPIGLDNNGWEMSLEGSLQSNSEGDLLFQGDFSYNPLNNPEKGYIIRNQGEVRYFKDKDFFAMKGQLGIFEDKEVFTLNSLEFIRILEENDEYGDEAYLSYDKESVSLGNIDSLLRAVLPSETKLSKLNIENLKENARVTLKKYHSETGFDSDGFKTFMTKKTSEITFDSEGVVSSKGSLLIKNLPEIIDGLRNGHRIEIRVNELVCGISKCSDCREVGQAYERLDYLLRNKAENARANLKLSDSSIIKQAYKYGNLEVFRVYDIEGYEEVFIYDSKKNNFYHSEYGRGFRQMNLEGRELVYSDQINHEFFNRELELAETEQIPSGAVDFTPRVNEEMLETFRENLNSGMPQIAGQIHVSNSYDKGGVVYGLDSKTLEYVSESGARLSVSEFNNLINQPDNSYAVIPYKYKQQEVFPKSGPIDVTIYDSRNERVGKITWEGLNRDYYTLKGPEGRVIGTYTEYEDAQKAFERKGLYEWYKKPSRDFNEGELESIFESFNSRGN